MNQFIFGGAVFLVSVPLSAKTPDKAKLALEIQKTTQTKFGYEVSIRVKNVSGATGGIMLTD